ncbi:MAG: tetratricopeptide repeat protein [Proteobacteria bacterium]|nr:MAG: tetratricopeptide repeat protein [Pseudomonadota bacterium]
MKQILKASLVGFLMAGLAVGCGSSKKKSDSSASADVADVQLADDGSEADVPSLKDGTDANDQSSKLDPKYRPLAQALRAGKSKLITEQAAKILGTNSNDPVALNALALVYIKRGQTGAAKLLLGRAFEKTPNSAALHNNYGVVQMQEDDGPGAISSFKKALRQEPTHQQALGNLGSVYMKGGDVTRALPLLEQSYKANKLNSGIANNYAIALRQSGDLAGASKLYEDLIKANAKDVYAHLNYAILLIDFMNKPKDGLTLVYKIKFLETEKKDVLARANALEKKAKAALQ